MPASTVKCKARGSSTNWSDLEQRPSELQKLGYHDGLPSPQGRSMGESKQWCFELNDEFYNSSESIFDPMPHYEEMFKK